MAKIGVYIDHRKLYIAAAQENEARLLPGPYEDAHTADLCTGGERTTFFAEDMDMFAFLPVFSHIRSVVGSQLQEDIEELVVAVPGPQAYRLCGELLSAAAANRIFLSQVITACDALAVASAYHRLLKCFARLEDMNQRFDAAQQARFAALQLLDPHSASIGHYVGMADLRKESESDISIVPNAVPEFWDDETEFILVSSQNSGIPALRKLYRDFPGTVEFCPEGTEALGALYTVNHEIFTYLPDVFQGRPES